MSESRVGRCQGRELGSKGKVKGSGNAGSRRNTAGEKRVFERYEMSMKKDVKLSIVTRCRGRREEEIKKKIRVRQTGRQGGFGLGDFPSSGAALLWARRGRWDWSLAKGVDALEEVGGRCVPSQCAGVLER